MGRNQQPKGGSYSGNKGNKTYAGRGKSGGNKQQTVHAATALGLGVPQQNTMLAGTAGLGIVQPNPLDLLFGSIGTNTVAGLGGFGGAGGAGVQSANSGNDLLQLAALLGGSHQQNVTFQPAQLLQVRQALQQQHATQVAAQQQKYCVGLHKCVAPSGAYARNADLSNVVAKLVASADCTNKLS